MLVATRSFRYDDPYLGLDEIKAGITHISEDHPLAFEFPQRFRPAPNRSAGSRERIYANLDWLERITAVDPRPTAPQATPPVPNGYGWEPWRIHPRPLSFMPSGPRVRFSALATGELFAELGRWRSDLETGALLYGGESPGFVEVIRAVGAGPHAERDRATFSFDPIWCQHRDAEMAAHGLTRCGEAHTHPIGPALPSPADSRVRGSPHGARINELDRCHQLTCGWSCHLAGATQPRLPGDRHLGAALGPTNRSRGLAGTHNHHAHHSSAPTSSKPEVSTSRRVWTYCNGPPRCRGRTSSSATGVSPSSRPLT